jgi:glycosyltransferase involved in cell wall biosynthesis
LNQIAYFVNQYPKVSHSFIRREILELEVQGFEILRIALRGWDAELFGTEDKLECSNTKYILKSGAWGLILPMMQIFATSPIKFLSTLWVALKMGIHADRSWPYHFVYFAEACLTYRWVSERHVKHIHAHFGTNSAEVVMLVNHLGGPSYSFTVHGPDEFDKPEFIKLKEKITNASFIVAVSSFGRSQLFRWIDYQDWQKVKVIHCGLENSFFSGKYQSLPTRPRLICVGRLCEQKGQLLLIEACHMLAEKGVDFELVLAGDGEMRSEIESLIKQYSLEQKIRILGWISSEEVSKEILASGAMVLPSFAEGLPVVIMEAMALRRPVLTTYIAGIPELVQHGENGWLFPAGDVDALVSALEVFFATPHKVLVEMGRAAYQRVLQRHSIEIEVNKLAQLFTAVDMH